MNEQPPSHAASPSGGVPSCSFCGKSQSDVARLIAGPNLVFICDQCVRLCSEIIAEESSPAVEGTRAWSWVMKGAPTDEQTPWGHPPQPGLASGAPAGIRVRRTARPRQTTLKLVTTREMRALEQGSVECGVSLDTLMDNAGLAVARRIHNLVKGKAGSALVLVGPGNNGGDGLVCAQHLYSWGWKVWLHLVPGKPRDADRFTILKSLQSGLVPKEPVDVVVDALLGTGSARPIEGPMAEALEAVRTYHQGARVVAVDLPSGVNADTGAADSRTLRADLTVTLGLAKVGLFQYPAQTYTGEVTVADIGIPPELSTDMRSWLSDADFVRPFLPPRPVDAHKGTFGKLLVVAGCANYAGAPYLGSMAAARIGVGLIRLAVPKGIHPVLASKFTETTFEPLPETEEGAISLQALETLARLLEADFDCLLIGSGLGQASETRELVQRLLLGSAKLPRRVVIDADGLNNIAGDPDWASKLPKACVLTPHPAEFGRLASLPIQEILGKRFEFAREKARAWGQIIVAKGANAIIAAPDGRVVIDPGAHPLVATAGSGDVLAGAIAGLLAQGTEAWEGAAAATRVCGQAVRQAAGHFGRAGMIASDLHDQLPVALRQIRG